MSNGKDQVINIYSQLIAQVIFISASGIAAGVALIQAGVVQDGTKTILIFSFVAFSLSLVCGVFCLTTLLGQADSTVPNIHVKLVRIPGLVAILSFILGTMLFVSSLTMGLSSHKMLVEKKQVRSSNYKVEMECELSPEQQALIKTFANKAFGNCNEFEEKSIP